MRARAASDSRSAWSASSDPTLLDENVEKNELSWKEADRIKWSCFDAEAQDTGEAIPMRRLGVKGTLPIHFRFLPFFLFEELHALVRVALPRLCFFLLLLSDVLHYLPQDDPLVIMFNDVGEKFGGDYLATIAMETDDIFNAKTLARVRRDRLQSVRLSDSTHDILVIPHFDEELLTQRDGERFKE